MPAQANMSLLTLVFCRYSNTIILYCHTLRAVQPDPACRPIVHDQIGARV